ncbi:MAG: HlyD family efflux transporter periplasmic adaptor subunit [Saprospiraceae bacterium]|nr:HlyD family efflux transporter periplasmic adaptor subunit [Saprospiraceae bacterium]
MRKVITSIIGLLLIVGAVFAARQIAASRNQPKPVENKIVLPVSIETVQNTSTPITLKTSGNLVAKNKVDIYSEVSGIFKSSAREFKPGSPYGRGQTLLLIDSDEFKANIKAQKSNLYNQIVLFMPDLRLDYPDATPQWEAYITAFDVEKPLQDFPKPTSEKEKLFLSSKGIFTSFYNISNLEERLDKYVIRAPFNGVLTEALVNPGALVRNGQKLGEFISTGVYEMEVDINVTYQDLLAVGKSVELHNLERTNSWMGRVIRVNGKVNQASQTIKVFIQVSDASLKEGMYLEADLVAKEEEDTYELDRKLIFDENKLYVIRDSVLDVAQVSPIFFKESTVVVKGLTDGTQIMAKPVPGAHKGMRVSLLK